MKGPGKDEIETYQRAWEAEGLRTAMKVIAEVERRSRGEGE